MFKTTLFLFLILASAAQCQAGMLVINIGGSELSGSGAGALGLAVKITIDDIAKTLQVDASSLRTGAKVFNLALNYDPFDSNAITDVTPVNDAPLDEGKKGKKPGFGFGLNNQKVIGNNKGYKGGYDLGLDFKPPAIVAPNVYTYNLTGNFSVANFIATNASGYYGAVHIGALENGKSGVYAVTSFGPLGAAGPVVPEPATFGLLLTGLACSAVGFRARRKR